MLTCFLDKPAAAPAAKKAVVDGKLFFVSEPQSIRVVESEYCMKNIHLYIYLSWTFHYCFNFIITNSGNYIFNLHATIIP